MTKKDKRSFSSDTEEEKDDNDQNNNPSHEKQSQIPPDNKPIDRASAPPPGYNNIYTQSNPSDLQHGEGGGGGGNDNNNNNDSLAAQTRRQCTTPPTDPNTGAGKLWSKMSAVVGANNILPPPTDWPDEDKKIFLKSDQNALLYFWYKSPKARAHIQHQFNQGCCYWRCHDPNGARNCCDCFFPFFSLVFPLIWLVAGSYWCCSSSGEVQTRSHMGSKKMFRDEASYKKYVTRGEKGCSCCFHEEPLSLNATRDLYDDIILPPI